MSAELPGRRLTDGEINDTAAPFGLNAVTAADMRLKLPGLTELVDMQASRVTAADAEVATARQALEAAEAVAQGERHVLTILTRNRTLAEAAVEERRDADAARLAAERAERQRQRDIEDGLIQLGKQAAR